ncbi:hypothetical protein GUITHDRAFT_44863, partial [Guillardia theta CCMP2712]
MGKKFSHPDKKVRDKAVMVFSHWIAKQDKLDESEHLKVWKALFYCYWMSDKVPIQQELAKKLAALIHDFPNTEQSERFILAFYKTMQREWAGIDRLRLDKFYNLIRCFQLETFRYLAKQGWEEEAVGRINTIIEEGPLCLRSEKFMSLGLQLHMIDIFLDEVTDVVDDGMSADSWLRIMEPYFNMMRSQCDKSVFDRIYRRIFL